MSISLATIFFASTAIMALEKPTEAPTIIQVITKTAEGFFLGVSEAITTHPMSYIKTRFQKLETSPSTELAARRALVSELIETLAKNPKVFYTGFGINALSTAPIAAFQVTLNEFFLNYRSGGDQKKLSSYEKLSCAFAAGALSACISTPAELIMTQQIDKNSTLADAAKAITHRAGMRALLQSSLPTMGRDGGYTMGYLALDDFLQKELSELLGYQINNVTAGILAGLIATTVTHPLDTIKTSLQLNLGSEAHKNIIEVTQKLLEDKALYKGYWARAAVVTTGITVMSMLKKTIKSLKGEE
jgi:hypothetical protein